MELVPVVVMFVLPMAISYFLALSLARRRLLHSWWWNRVAVAALCGTLALAAEYLLTAFLLLVREQSFFATGGSVAILFWEVTLALGILTAFVTLTMRRNAVT
jgi:hypothetical protein